MTAESSYGHVEPVQIHIDDLDVVGMVHHTRYPLLVERAVSAYWLDRGWSLDTATSTFDDVCLVVRELRITYHVPIRHVRRAAVHFWIERLGRTSSVYGFRVLSADGTVTHAEGGRVVVKLDPRTGRPSPFTEALRAASSSLFREPALAGRSVES